MYIHSGEAKGFKVGRVVKEEGTGGGVAHFSDKVKALIPAFIPVNFGKVPNPFDF
jgi:hypothetical protein